MQNFINIELVSQLIQNQFPEYQHLPISAVSAQGHDNRTFRLGQEMLVRLPSAAVYAEKIPIEQKVLMLLSEKLTLSIPSSIHLGHPEDKFPYPFAIYSWIDGVSLNLESLNADQNIRLASDLADFLRELHEIKSDFILEPGQHNWWRGAHIQHYHNDAISQITRLQDDIEAEKALNLWQSAMQTKWLNPPVWVHGDLAVGNLVIKNKQLNAVIDFGGSAVGDPACDLVMAWTYFDDHARKIFMDKLVMDENSWLRAKAWALWKSTYELCQIKNKNTELPLTEAELQEPLLKQSTLKQSILKQYKIIESLLK